MDKRCTGYHAQTQSTLLWRDVSRSWQLCQCSTIVGSSLHWVMEILTVIPVAAVSFVIICFLVLQYQAKEEKKSFKPGKVIIHQFSPSDLTPSGSPPCFKLETFLRMTRIPYENSYGMKFSKKGKMPWIEFNGLAIADSNFCIQFLMKEFHVDVDSHLSATERAAGHSIRTMLEESTYW